MYVPTGVCVNWFWGHEEGAYCVGKSREKKTTRKEKMSMKYKIYQKAGSQSHNKSPKNLKNYWSKHWSSGRAFARMVESTLFKSQRAGWLHLTWEFHPALGTHTITRIEKRE